MKINEEELEPIALNSFSPPWKAFMQGVCVQENLTTFEKLSNAFIQEETRHDTVVVKSMKFKT